MASSGTPPKTPSAPPPPTPTARSAVVKPKFGGELTSNGTTYQWVGGPPSALFVGTSRTSPRTPMCIRGLDPISNIKGYSRRVMDGNATKFKRDDPEYPLMAFAADVKRHMEAHGLDTVFYMVGGSDAKDLFDYHSNYTKKQVVEAIEKRTLDKTFDEYALTALSESAEWLNNSLDATMKASLRAQIAAGESGPVLWMSICNEVLADSLRRSDNLVKEFEALTVSKFKGENVAQYATAVQPILMQLERADQLPRLHLLTIVEQFSKVSVLEFRIHWMGRRGAIEQFISETAGKTQAAINSMKRADRITYIDLLEEGKNKYNNLSNVWGPAKSHKEDNQLAGLTAKIGRIESKVDQALTLSNGSGGIGNGGGGGNRSDKRRCFNCNEEGHFAKDCPKPKKPNSNGGNGGGGNNGKEGNKSADNWRHSAPKDGEPTTKKVDGTTFHFCPKCRRGKGVWTSTHSAAEHKEGFHKDKKDASSKNSSGAAGTIGLVPTLENWIV